MKKILGVDPLYSQIIFKKYKITNKINSGSFGTVYEAKNIINNTLVAIKLEQRNKQNSLLENEALYLFEIKGKGIPKFITYGKNNKYNILIMELLGKSFNELLSKLIKKDIYILGIQIIEILEIIHIKYNLLHRDIKPSNFLIGKTDPTNVYLIDYGFAKRYKSSINGKHIIFHRINYFIGSKRFSSINAMKFFEQSRRDDLISLGYSLIYLLNKYLPWQIFEKDINLSPKQRIYKIYNSKLENTPEKLCKGLPEELIEFMNYCQKLKFEEEPDYKYLKGLLKYILIKNIPVKEIKFNWINDNNNSAGIIKRLFSRGKTETKKENIKLTRIKPNFKRKESLQMRLYKTIKKSMSERRNSNNDNSTSISDILETKKNNTVINTNANDNNEKNFNIMNYTDYNNFHIKKSENKVNINNNTINYNNIKINDNNNIITNNNKNNVTINYYLFPYNFSQNENNIKKKFNNIITNNKINIINFNNQINNYNTINDINFVYKKNNRSLTENNKLDISKVNKLLKYNIKSKFSRNNTNYIIKYKNKTSSNNKNNYFYYNNNYI